jgi:hypothetical protein
MGVVIYKQGIILKLDRNERKEVGLKGHTCLRSWFFQTPNPDEPETKKNFYNESTKF